MNKYIVIVFALVLIASQAFKMRTKQDVQDYTAQAQAVIQQELAQLDQFFQANFPDQYALTKNFAADGQAINNIIVENLVDVAEAWASESGALVDTAQQNLEKLYQQWQGWTSAAFAPVAAPSRR